MMPTTGGAGGTGASGFTFWDIGGCNCPIAPITVQSCHQHAGSGLTVAISLTSGGAALWSGTTDANGEVFPTGIAPGTYWVSVTGQNARLNSYNASTALHNGAGNTVTLTAAAGYTCLGTLPCPIPTSTTLKYTGPKGPETLTWNGATWKSADGVVELTVGNLASNTQITYNGGMASTTCSSYACPTATSLSFFDGSTVTE